MKDAGAALLRLARELGRRLRERNYVLVAAESCTAGGVAYAITQVAGSSAWFDRGMVVYSNEAKREMLGVPAALLRDHGAVSEEVARAMALGALRNSPAQAALAVTGIAGPDGGSAHKPVGTVCFAWALRPAPDEAERILARTCHFAGDRAAVRTQSIAESLLGMRELLRRA
jgi:nicotinamide-nucleotide amidase